MNGKSSDPIEIEPVTEDEYRQSTEQLKLQSVDQIIKVSYSKSTLANMARSEKLIIACATKHSEGDPLTAFCSSTQLLMILIIEKCRYSTSNAIKIDTMGGYVQGLRLVYAKCGHRGTWICNPESRRASGNSLVQNPEFEKFRRAYKVNLERYGDLKH